MPRPHSDKEKLARILDDICQCLYDSSTQSLVLGRLASSMPTVRRVIQHAMTRPGLDAFNIIHNYFLSSLQYQTEVIEEENDLLWKSNMGNQVTTLLIAIAECKPVEEMEVLLLAGFTLPRIRTAHCCCAFNNRAFLEYLLQRDLIQLTPACWAFCARGNSLACYDYLLTKQVEIPENILQLSLYQALKRSHLEMAGLFLARGAQVTDVFVIKLLRKGTVGAVQLALSSLLSNRPSNRSPSLPASLTDSSVYYWLIGREVAFIRQVIPLLMERTRAPPCQQYITVSIFNDWAGILKCLVDLQWPVDLVQAEKLALAVRSQRCCNYLRSLSTR